MVIGIPASVSSIPLSRDHLFTFTVSHPTCPATHTDSTNLSITLCLVPAHRGDRVKALTRDCSALGKVSQSVDSGATHGLGLALLTLVLFAEPRALARPGWHTQPLPAGRSAD